MRFVINYKTERFDQFHLSFTIKYLDLSKSKRRRFRLDSCSAQSWCIRSLCLQWKSMGWLWWWSYCKKEIWICRWIETWWNNVLVTIFFMCFISHLNKMTYYNQKCQENNFKKILGIFKNTTNFIISNEFLYKIF